MKKVTYRPYKPLKNQKDIIEFTEATEDMIRLRGLALSWYVISIEAV